MIDKKLKILNLDQSSVEKLTGLSKVKNSTFLQAVIVSGSLARDHFFFFFFR